MRRISRLALSAAAVVAPLTAALLVAAPLRAQAPGSGTVLHVTPYAGVMVLGNYLNGPLGTTFSNRPGGVYGVQAGLSLSPQLSVVGNVATTSSSMQVGIPFLGGVSVGSSSMLMYDADLEYDFAKPSSTGKAFSPFVQAGVGQMRYDITVSGLETNATNFDGNVGAGVDFAVAKGIALRVLAKDYIGKFNFQDATGLGITGSTANNIGVTAGLRFDF